MATKAKQLHTCDMCGSTFKDGNDKEGMPNGLSFVMAEGTVTVCNRCISRAGIMNDDEQDLFFDELRKKVHK